MTTPFKPLKRVASHQSLPDESEMNISIEEASCGCESPELASPPKPTGRVSLRDSSSGLFGGTASRLFGDDDNDNEEEGGVFRPSVLKPLDLNQERTGAPRRRQDVRTPVRKTGRGDAHRKRHAEHQLIGRDLSFDDVEDDEVQNHHHNHQNHSHHHHSSEDQQNSPVDMMMQSPRISPTCYKSPVSHRAAAPVHKSPRYRTMDGRTVQSKNPFSPMYTEDPSALAITGGTAPLTDSLNLPTSLGGAGPAPGGHSGAPFLRHRLQKRETHLDLSASFSASSAPGSPPTPRFDAARWDSFTRDGYPERQGRYSFTGSPIHEMDLASSSADDHDNSQPPLPKHKVPRRSRTDDAAAASTNGEALYFVDLKPTTTTTTTTRTKKKAPHLFVHTQPQHNNDEDETSYYRRIDDISPTDVFSFPAMASPSSPTTPVPPTPSKPRHYRRRPRTRYTPVRKPAVPPTPMIERRTRSSFDSDDEDHHPGGGGDESTGSSLTNGSTRAAPSRFHSDFDIIDELGNGSFGNVFKVMSRLDGCMYAIKVAHRPAKGASDKDRMLKEVYALAALSDQADTATFHIVRYHQAWMEEHRLYIQTELCTSTLAAEMKERALGPLSVDRRYKFLREMCLALEFIHKNGMVHLDIKPENIFVKNDQFKLGDFGLVSKVSEHDVEEGDSRYMSMELLSGDHADLTKSDMFSLGITLYEICLAGTRPLPTNGPEWQALRQAKFAAPLSNTPNEMQSLILLMMNPCHSLRPGASDLLKRPQLLSPEQKALLAERNKVAQANLALAALTVPPARKVPKGLLVRSNTWTGSYSH